MSTSRPYGIFTEEGVLLSVFIESLIDDTNRKEITSPVYIEIKLHGGNRVNFSIENKHTKKWYQFWK